MESRVSGEAVGNEEPIRGDPELATTASEGGIDLDTETTPPAVDIAPLPEVVVEWGGRSETAEVISRSDLSLSGQADIPSSIEERGNMWL